MVYAGLVVNVLIGLALVVWGNLVLKRHPCTETFIAWLQARIDSFVGDSYCVPFYITGCVFVLLGLLALVNAFLMVAQRCGFWLL